LSNFLRTILMVLAITVIVWVVDASFQTLRHPAKGYMDHLLLGVDSTEAANRLLITAVVLVLGTGLGLSMGRARQAHAHRRSTERQLQTILDSMPELVLWFDADLRIVWANQAALNANPDAIGLVCSEAFDCTCSEETHCACRRALTSGRIESETVCREGIRGVAGTSYWEDVAVPLKGPADEVVGIVGIGRDITERERDRRQLQFQAQLLSSVREAVIAVDHDRRIVYWNRGAEEMFGYTIEEATGQSIFMMYLNEWKEQVLPEVREGLEQSGMWVGRAPLVHRDGSRIQAEVMLSAWQDEQGRRAGTIGLCRDITPEVEAEQALRESERRYRVMFQSSHAMSLLIDTESGRILDANDKAVRFYGWTREELLEMRIQDINTLSEEEICREMRQARKENRNHFFFCHRLASGDLRDVEVYSGPIELRGRAALYSIIYDITERKRTERRLEQYRQRLRSLASELAMAEDRQRRRMAAALHDGIGQQLFAIKAKLAQLRKRDNHPRAEILAAEGLSLVDQTMRDTRDLTFDLCPPVLYEFGLDAALQWLVQKFSRQYNMDYRVTSDSKSDDLPPDTRGLLYQAARELLTNAAKHAQATRVDVSVCVREDSVEVTVEDNGAGFAPGVRPLERQGDSGFGLFSIHERLSSIGGRLTVESTPGQGTCVKMRVCVPEEKMTPGSET